MGLHLNQIEGLTSSAAELNILDGLTATTAELNKLDGLTSSTAELNSIAGLVADLLAHLSDDLLTAHSLASLNGGLIEDATVTLAKLDFVPLLAGDLASLSADIVAAENDIATLETQVDQIITLVAPGLTADFTNTIQQLVDHLADATDAHNASSISVAPAGNISSTDVQAALVEIQGDFDGHLSDAVDAHDASAISVSPSGNLASTEVQAALVELQLDVDGRASRALDNLTSPTAVNQHLIPSPTNSKNLGSTAANWNFLYTGNITRSGTGVITVQTPAQSAADTGSGQLNFLTGDANGSGFSDSGLVLLWTGASANYDSGKIDLKTGTSSTLSGDILLTTGDASGAGDSGDITLITGSAGGTRGVVEVQPELQILGTTSGYVGLTAGATPTPYSIQLPSVAPTASQVLQAISPTVLKWVGGEYDAGNSTATKTIDFANGDSQKVTMTADCTFTFNNMVAGSGYHLRLLQDGTGGWDPTLPVNCKFPGGTPPTGSAASKNDLLSLYYDGTDVYVNFSLDY